MNIANLSQIIVSAMIFVIVVYGMVRYSKQNKKTEKKIG